MIVTLTPNPAVDLTIRADRISRGGTTVVDGAISRAGGKGLNVSRILAQLGVPTSAVAPVGAADAPWFAADLAGVPHTLIECAAATRRSYVLHEQAHDVTSVINERGPVRTPQEWARVLRALDETLAASVGASVGARDAGGVSGDAASPGRRAAGREADRAGCLAMCGSIPPGAPVDLVGRVVDLGARYGMPVVVDTSGDALLAAARAGATLLKPNRHELAAVFGEVTALDGARALQELGAQLVIVSLGEDGLVLVPPRGPAVRACLGTPLRGNPTGAGDAAVAGAASLLADPSLRRSLLAGAVAATTRVAARAAAWSAAAVLMPEAGEIHADHDRIERRLAVDVF